MSTDGLLSGLAMLAWSWPPDVSIGLPATAALAAVALIGYLFGQRTRTIEKAILKAAQQREMEAASSAAHQLESIAESLRRELAEHHGRLIEFRSRLLEAHASRDEQTWQALCRQAEQMLSPTKQLTERLSVAYDAMRQRADTLQTLSQSRIDPVTGVGNAHALAENLDVFLAAARSGGLVFSLVLVGVDGAMDGAKDHHRSAGKHLLQRLAQLVRASVRETDFVARYGDDELLVLLPNVRLAGACSISERWRRRAADELTIAASCGVAEYQEGDDAKSLLTRADAASYCARAAGGNRQYIHTGTQLLEYRPVRARQSASDEVPAEAAAEGSPEPALIALAANCAAGE